MLLGFTYPALADEDLREMLNALSTQVAALKDQLQQSNARINELEGGLERADKRVLQPSAKLAVTDEAKPAVTLGDMKDTFKIPGSNTSLGFGGFTKLDVIHNSVGAIKPEKLGNQVFLASQIPVGSGSENRRQGEVVLHAKESRIWFKSFTPNEFGDVTTHFEFDMLVDGNTYTPRSRHAYGSIGNLLGGQTWTTFLNVKAIPETMDNIGSVGMLSPMRQPLVRWSQGIDGTGFDWQIAAEAPNGQFITSDTGDEIKDTKIKDTNMSPVPDLVARLNYTSKSASISLATMARKIQNDNNKIQSAWGGAVSASGKIDFFQSDSLMFMASYGNALGRYTNGNVFEDAALDANGNMELVDVYSVMLSYQHAWNRNWRSTAVFGVEHADQTEFVSQLMTKQAESLHLNLLWSPVPKSTIGIEFIHGARELVSGKSGALNRVQFSTRFNF